MINVLMAIVFTVVLASCGLGEVMSNSGVWDASPANSALEDRQVETAPTGEEVLLVKPHIRSRDELVAYRELKITEAQEILSLTEEESRERPYYPAVITLAGPISVKELNELLARYNPSIEKAIQRASYAKSSRLAKAELVKDEDALVINTIRFTTTTGRGQLSYESMTKGDELARLEDELAHKERELNGIENFQLIAGINTIIGGVHRDDVMSLNDDPQVFLADIGPIEMYRGDVDYARWDDMSALVERYLNH